jgi:protein required for attachment to host cells
MKTDIWVLSADTHKARLFCAATPYSHDMVEIETFVQPDTVLPERDLVSDGLGRFSQQGGGRGGEQHHPKLPRTSPKDKRVQEFARHIGNYLEAEHKKGHFAKLGLVASPQMLGELRTQLSPTLERDVCFEIDKNITHLSGAAFRQQLPEKLVSTQ